MSFWRRLVREAQRPPSVGLAALGTGLLAAGVANPLLAVLAAPAYAAWGVYLVSRALRAPDLRGDAIKAIEQPLAEVARARYGAEHPASVAPQDRSAARVRRRFEELMAELDIAHAPGERRGRAVDTDNAEEFERQLRQFRRIVAGEDTILNRLRNTPSGVPALPAGLLADVTHLVNWAEQISRQRAEYLTVLTAHSVQATRQRIEEKKREASRLPQDERGEVLASIELLESELERRDDLQREVRSIENQLDMIESLVNNLILSTPNLPSARDQIARVKRNVETFQTVNREVRERLESRSAPPRLPSGLAAEAERDGGARP
jgi:chromosome segregation ATPase